MQDNLKNENIRVNQFFRENGNIDDPIDDDECNSICYNGLKQYFFIMKESFESNKINSLIEVLISLSSYLKNLDKIKREFHEFIAYSDLIFGISLFLTNNNNIKLIDSTLDLLKIISTSPVIVQQYERYQIMSKIFNIFMNTDDFNSKILWIFNMCMNSLPFIKPNFNENFFCKVKFLLQNINDENLLLSILSFLQNYLSGYDQYDLNIMNPIILMIINILQICPFDESYRISINILSSYCSNNLNLNFLNKSNVFMILYDLISELNPYFYLITLNLMKMLLNCNDILNINTIKIEIFLDLIPEATHKSICLVFEILSQLIHIEKQYFIERILSSRKIKNIFIDLNNISYDEKRCFICLLCDIVINAPNLEPINFFIDEDLIYTLFDFINLNNTISEKVKQTIYIIKQHLTNNGAIQSLIEMSQV